MSENQYAQEYDAAFPYWFLGPCGLVQALLRRRFLRDLRDLRAFDADRHLQHRKETLEFDVVGEMLVEDETLNKV